MATLPVCGAEFRVKGPDGASEIIVLEAALNERLTGLTLLSRVAVLKEQIGDLSGLTVTDFEYLLLSLRAAWLGPQIALALACETCREMAEMRFDIAALLDDVTPRAVSGVGEHPTRPGWFSLDGGAFRLPTIGDQIEAASRPHPAKSLAAVCLDETAQRRPLRAKAERTMQAMAPEVSRSIGGACPSCGAHLEAHFSVCRIVIGELRHDARELLGEIDTIARAYHWPQHEILSLPQERRRAYVERIRRAPAQAA